MKRMWIVLFATLATSCFGQEHYLYGKTYALSNFYLHDNTNVALHLRVPTGEVARVDTGIFQPDGAIAFRGGAISLRGPVQLFTNQFTMTYVSNGVSAEETSVVIRANGEIVLNRFVAGVGWTSVTINATNPLPNSMLPTGGDYATNYMQRNGAWMVKSGGVGMYQTDIYPNSTNYLGLIFNQESDQSGLYIKRNANVGTLYFLTNRWTTRQAGISTLEANHTGDISGATNLPPLGLNSENAYTGGTMRLITTNGTTFRWE